MGTLASSESVPAHSLRHDRRDDAFECDRLSNHLHDRRHPSQSRGDQYRFFDRRRQGAGAGGREVRIHHLSAGIIGTGLLAVPVLAGSAAFGVGEATRWEVGLRRKPKEAVAFYATLAAAAALGTGIMFTPIDPIQALYWSAVINGICAVPVMVVMMLMAGRSDIMGEFTVGGWLRALGWLATVAMALSVVGLALQWML